MGSTAFTTELTSGLKNQSTDDVETFTLQTRGRRNLTVIPDISAEGTGQAYLIETTGAIFPLVLTSANNVFQYNSNAYTIAAGTYANTTTLAAAIGAATHSTVALSTILNVTAVDSTHIEFQSIATGAVTHAFNDGASDDFWTAAAGWTDGDALAGAGADSAGSITVNVYGVDPVSGITWLLIGGAAITADDTPTPLRVGPGLTAVSNAVANDVLPDTVQVTVTHNDDNAITYTLVAQLAG